MYVCVVARTRVCVRTDVRACVCTYVCVCVSCHKQSCHSMGAGRKHMGCNLLCLCMCHHHPLTYTKCFCLTLFPRNHIYPSPPPPALLGLGKKCCSTCIFNAHVNCASSDFVLLSCIICSIPEMETSSCTCSEAEFFHLFVVCSAQTGWIKV